MQAIMTAGLVLALLAAPGRPADEAQMHMMRNRLVALYTGQRENPGVPLQEADIAVVEERARGILDGEGQARGRRGGVNARTVLALAEAWSTPGSALQNSPELKERIESELAQIEERIRPGSPHPGNWYNWLIATPRNLGPALLLCEGRIDQYLFEACVAGIDDCLPEMSLHGANAAMEARNNVYLALLQHDPEHLTRAVDYLRDQMVVGGGAAGILEDYTFQFHGRLLHTSGYGADYAVSVAQIVYLCEGTRWAVSQDKKRLLARQLLEHVPWPVIGRTYDLSVRGRQVSTTFDTGEHIDAMMLLAAVDHEHAPELHGAAARLRGDEAAGGGPVPPPFGFRHFYTGDFAVFRRSDFCTSVRMYSDRVIDYEGNPSMAGGTNLSGWFLCYGLTSISRNGENQYGRGTLGEDFDWDRLPGTTTRVGVHPPYAYNLGRTNFAGGAGGDRRESGGVCGFVLLPAAGNYTARKSYHFFDRGFLALGSGIASTGEHPEHVVTTVTQWAAPEADLPLVLSGGRRVGAVEGDASWDDVQWAWHDGAGYVFFEPGTLHGHRRGVLTTLWLDHGAAPNDAAYAYVVLSNATQEETAAFARKPSVRIVRHDGVAHACEDASRHAMGVVFWQAGEAAGIAADAPAVCYVEPRGLGKVVTVQNPLHTEATLKLRLSGRLPGVEAATPEAMVQTRADESRVTVNTVYGRIYRVGLGVSDVSQQPRADFAPYKAVGCDGAFSDGGRVVTVTVQVPERAAQEGYRLLLRGRQGHLLAELTERDVIDRPDPNAVRYRWNRAASGLGGRETSARVVVLTEMYQSESAPFTLPSLAGE